MTEEQAKVLNSIVSQLDNRTAVCEKRLAAIQSSLSSVVTILVVFLLLSIAGGCVIGFGLFK